MVEPKAFQDALLAYHARPCDAEAEAVRDAVLDAYPVSSVTWEMAERIADVPAVAQAIGNLLEDQTGDNATCLVRAVLEAARASGDAT